MMSEKAFQWRGAIFDLDGTLLDTLSDIAGAANAVLAKLELPTHPVEAYKIFVGDGVHVLMKRVLPVDWHSPEKLDHALDLMKKEYLNWLNREAAPYPEIPAILDELVGHGCRLAVLSNKPHHLTELCMNQFFGTYPFDPILGLRPGHAAKPDPSGAMEIVHQWNLHPEDILFLGDTSIDMETASKCGMFPVGVLWGFRERSELESAGARFVTGSANHFFNQLEIFSSSFKIQES
jgi:phosphoglycolate phosphatase